jgi:hypothetical protein
MLASTGCGDGEDACASVREDVLEGETRTTGADVDWVELDRDCMVEEVKDDDAMVAKGSAGADDGDHSVEVGLCGGKKEAPKGRM